jgi:hypothetical protein
MDRTLRRSGLVPKGDGTLVLLARWLAEVSADAALAAATASDSNTATVKRARRRAARTIPPRWARPSDRPADADLAS